MASHLLLASSSPRRRELLAQTGLPFTVVPVDFSELTARQAPWLSPGELAHYNANGKARSAQPRHPEEIILAADTVVALDNRIFEKPANRQEAQRFLQELSGRTHCVITALSLAWPSKNITTRLTTTRVTFHPLSLKLIQKYLRHVHVLDKAGAYAIQKHSDWIIQSIDGSISNVIGLPLETLAQMLKTKVG